MKIKALADVRPIAVDDADSIIRAFYRNLKHGDSKPLLDDLTAEEAAALKKKELELRKEPEKRALDEQVDAEVSTEHALKKARTNTVKA